MSRSLMKAIAASRSGTGTADGPSSGEAATRELLPFLLRAVGAPPG
ncbi:hypothetical protein RM550_00950 [Streptomyces sp. DSM 41527]|uniref:Uncharacterized protein n=1 Tax=Streptomyces mooreae TaxID=3075523 RepID=A0ABU2T282_9ACTN|nr:hypothetical protein [Streptomyces sp. DSM 41527]MDT0454305.1 hypothetical protein [Streptomyces sp. DSM 41527]